MSADQIRVRPDSPRDGGCHRALAGEAPATPAQEAFGLVAVGEDGQHEGLLLEWMQRVVEEALEEEQGERSANRDDIQGIPKGR